MYSIFALLVTIFILILLGRYLLERNWALIYVAIGHDKYFKIINKLQAHGIKYRVKTPSAVSNNLGWRNEFQQYDIYVKKEDEQKAQQAIQF